MNEIVKLCKKAYADGNMSAAWGFWCSIYEFFESQKKDNHEELFKVMEQFTNDEVYAITDYGKKLNGYA